MGLFNKLFGSKKKEKAESDAIPKSSDEAKGMTNFRHQNLIICQTAGFKPASSLPTEFDRQVRPSIEIAYRLHAIKSLVLWLMVPEENLPNDKILEFVRNNALTDWMTIEERKILDLARDDEGARNAIGWKFENAWPLAWYFGYTEPEISGQMMDGDQMREILMEHTSKLDQKIENWVEQKAIITEDELIQKEDLFYCLHNAVRSAQLGGNTVPNGFDPMGNGGVIHERRHSLTWMLSKNTKWEETDLST